MPACWTPVSADMVNRARKVAPMLAYPAREQGDGTRSRGGTCDGRGGSCSGSGSEHAIPNVSRPVPWPEDLLPRALALCGTVLLLALAAKLLLGPVRTALAPVQAAERIRLVTCPGVEILLVEKRSVARHGILDGVSQCRA